MTGTTRHGWASFCYALAVLISISNMLMIIYIHRVPLFTGRGLGSFVALWFVLYTVPSAAIWLIGNLLERQRNWTICYWASVGLMVVMMAAVPMKFYID